jgi:hypothetical protein
MKERLEIDRQDNPELKNTIKELAIRVRESALYLAVMGNITAGTAPKEYIPFFWLIFEELMGY